MKKLDDLESGDYIMVTHTQKKREYNFFGIPTEDGDQEIEKVVAYLIVASQLPYVYIMNIRGEQDLADLRKLKYRIADEQMKICLDKAFQPAKEYYNNVYN